MSVERQDTPASSSGSQSSSTPTSSAPAAGRASSGGGGGSATTRALRGMSFADGEAALTPRGGGGGAPLDGATRARMERSFGADFGGVRVHQGGQAAALGAKAYTQGSDLHFAPGQYDPTSGAGKELIGHELAHVVQQGSGRVASPQPKRGAAPGAANIQADAGLEREADVAGARAARGEPAALSGGGGGGAAGAGSTAASAPIQRKEDERLTAKAGTYEHAQAAQAMLRGDADPRFDQLVRALRDDAGAPRTGCGAGIFHQASLALAGRGLDLSMASYGAQVARVVPNAPGPFSITRDIDTAFGTGTVAAMYLHDMVRDGAPSFRMKVALLAGLGPDGKVPKALRGEMESASAADVRAVHTPNDAITAGVKAAMGAERYDALLAYHDAANPAPAPVAAAPAAAAPAAPAPPDRGPILRARDRQLCAMLTQHTLGRNVDAEHVLDEVKALLPELKKDERDFLAGRAGPGGATSAFYTRLEAAADSAIIGALTQKNFQLIVDTLATGHITGAIDPADDDTKDEVEKADKANEVAAGLKHLKRGTTDNNSVKTQVMRGWFGRGEEERAALKAKIDGMSDMERREFLASKVNNDAAAAKLRDPTVPMADCAPEVERAWVQFAAELQNAKFRDREIAAIKARFKSGSVAGSHYLALVDLASSPTVVFGSFVARTIDLLRQLGPGETAQLVKDAALVKRLYQRSNDDKTWRADIEPLIGVAVDASGNVPAAKLAAIAGDATLKGAARDQATDDAFDLNPARLAKLVALAVHGITTNKAKVIGLAQQVGFAADRWAKLGQTPGAQRRLNVGAVGATRAGFIEAVKKAVPADALTWLQTGIPKVHQLLVGTLPPGAEVNVDDRLDAAKGGRLSHADKAQITASFEDLPPAALLKEWSDFPEHKRDVLDELEKPHLAANHRRHLEALKRNYVIGIAPERYAYLNAQLDRAQVVENEKKLLAKLRAAAESDAAVRKALDDAGVQNDDLAHELMTTTGTLSEHSMRASGYQNTLGSGKSGAMREARTAMVGEARKAEVAQRAPGADKDKARDDGAEALKDKREKYEERAKSFEKMKAKLESGILLALEVLAYLAVTAATAGAGAVAAGAMEVIIKSVVIAMKAASSVLVKHAMRGDGYSWKDTLVELGVAAAEVAGEWVKFAIDTAIAGMLTKNHLGVPEEGEADGRALYQVVGADIVTAIGKSSGGVIQEIAKSGTEQLANDGTNGADQDIGRKVRNLGRVAAMGMVAEPLKDKTGAAVREGMGAHSNGVISNSVVGFATAEYGTNPRIDKAVSLPVTPEAPRPIDRAPERSTLSVQLDTRLRAASADYTLTVHEAEQLVAAASGAKAELVAADVNTDLDGYIATIGAMDAKVGPIVAKVAATKGAVDTIAAEAKGDPQAEATGAQAKQKATTITTDELGKHTRDAVDGAETARKAALTAAQVRLNARWAALVGANGVPLVVALGDEARVPGTTAIAAPRVTAALKQADDQRAALRTFAADAKKAEGPASALAQPALAAVDAIKAKVDATTAAVAERNASAAEYARVRGLFQRSRRIDANDPATAAALDAARAGDRKEEPPRSAPPAAPAAAPKPPTPRGAP